MTQTEIDISAETHQLCHFTEVLTPVSESETPLLGDDTNDRILPAHTRPESEWDDCDRAAHAAANGEPMPPGWACITGDMIAKAQEWEATAEIRKGFQTRRSEERDKSAGMRATKQLLRMPIVKPQADTCPGCFQPMGMPQQWDDGPVCSGCHAKATASPGGFGITLGRAVRWNGGNSNGGFL